MRNLALALAAAVMLFAAPASTLAVEFDVGPGGVRVEPHRYNHGYYRHGYGRYGYAPDCRTLRQACLKKGELGEVGRGNCERYRRLCR